MNRPAALCTDTYLDFDYTLEEVEEAEQVSLLEFGLDQAQRWGLGEALGAQLLEQVFADLLATQQWQRGATVLEAWREALLEHMAHGEVRERMVVRLQMMQRHLRWCAQHGAQEWSCGLESQERGEMARLAAQLAPWARDWDETPEA